MKTLRQLLPAAIGVAIVAGLTLFLLDRGSALGPWLLAVLLFAHGWVHLMFFFPAPDPSRREPGSPRYPFVMADSWLIGRAGLEEARVRVAGFMFVGVTFAGFVLAALATVGWLVPAGWWGTLVLGASVLSTCTLLMFVSPLLLLGFGINAALAWLVLSSAWAPGGGGGA